VANTKAIHSVGASFVTYLRNAYAAVHPADGAYPSCDFRLLSSGELAALSDSDLNSTVSVYLFSITIDDVVRNAPSPGLSNDLQPLWLNLHYLVTVWSDSPSFESMLSAWVMYQLHSHPIMDVATLSADAGWAVDEVVHIVPAQIAIGDMMRMWDSFGPKYHLSLPYIARVVRIEETGGIVAKPVVATSYSYAGKEQTPRA
jgi:hypothetical protein